MKMNAKSFSSLLVLALMGVFIWLRGTLGVETTSDTLPLLAAFPLYIWLTMPWKWLPQPAARLPLGVYLGLGLFMAGVAGDSTLLLAVAWVILFDAFQCTFLERLPRRFLILPIFGFPWVTQNLDSLG